MKHSNKEVYENASVKTDAKLIGIAPPPPTKIRVCRWGTVPAIAKSVPAVSRVIAGVLMLAAGGAWGQNYTITTPVERGATWVSITWTHSVSGGELGTGDLQQCTTNPLPAVSVATGGTVSGCDAWSNADVFNLGDPKSDNFRWTGLDPDTPYIIRLQGGPFGVSQALGFRTLADAPPVITMPVVTPANPMETDTVRVAVTATDFMADGTTPFTNLRYLWTQISAVGSCDGSESAASGVTLVGATGAAISFATVERTSNLVVHLRVRVRGSNDGDSYRCVTVTVVGDDDAPEVNAGEDVMVTPGGTVSLRATVDDIDEDEGDLSWRCVDDAGAEFATSATADITIEIPGDYLAEASEGMRVITCTAMEDADNEDDMVLVTVRAAGGGEVVDEAVLPGVIGNINRGINSSIYRRIEQRQKAEGYWK